MSKRTLTQTNDSELDFINATTNPSKIPRTLTSPSHFEFPPPSPPPQLPLNNVLNINTKERAKESPRLCQGNTKNTQNTRGASMHGVDNDNNNNDNRISQPRLGLSQNQNLNQNQNLPPGQLERTMVRFGEDGRKSSSSLSLSSSLQSRSANWAGQRPSSIALVPPVPGDFSSPSSSSSSSPSSSSTSSPPSSSTSSSSDQRMRLHAMLGKQKYKSEVYKEQLKEQRRRNKELEDRLAETSKQLLQVQGRDDADETVHLHTKTKIISLSKKLEQKEQRMKDLATQKTYLQTVTTHLRSQIQDAQTESRTQITRLQNTQNALSKKLQESHAQVTHLRHVVMTGNTEKKALEGKLCALEENLHASEETLRTTEQNLHTTEQNLHTSEQNLHTSAENLHTSECARKHISNELLMQVNANMHLVGEIKSMEERVRFLERERDGFRVELDRRMVVVSNVEEVDEVEGEVGVGVGVWESMAVEAPGAEEEEEEQVVGEEDESLFGI